LYNIGAFVGRKTYGDRGDHADRNKILKKQIEKLKIENARLRKELNKLVGHVTATSDPQEEVQEDRKREIFRCPECGSPNTGVVDLSTKDAVRNFLVCKEKGCGYKKKI
jgi:DNA-directed RNA polymerase subunit M/transcription elongation factor TFIIS